MPPWQGGGNMIADVTFERSLYQGAAEQVRGRHRQHRRRRRPRRRRCDYVERIGVEHIAAYEHALLEYATPRLADIPGLRLIGTAAEKASVLSFVLAGHEPTRSARRSTREGIAVRAGHHCAQPILRRFGLEATVRPSLAFYNTFDEIDVFLDAVRRIAEGVARPAPESSGASQPPLRWAESDPGGIRCRARTALRPRRRSAHRSPGRSTARSCRRATRQIGHVCIGITSELVHQ